MATTHGNVVILDTEQTGPRLEEVWAYVCRDTDGRENVIGGTIPGFGMVQLVTGNPKTFETFTRLAETARAELESTKKTIHLLHFSHREELPF